MQVGVFFQIWEWMALPVYLIVIFLFAYLYQRRKMEENPIYRYFSWGMLAHIMGALFLGFIYEYYYQSGDTFGYFLGAVNMDRLLFHSPIGWLRNEFLPTSPANYACFTDDTGYPWPYMYNDPRTMMVIRFINLMTIPCMGSYLLSSVMVALFCYTGIWKLYIVFTKYYPKLYKQLALAVLFFPSVLFWASGILKDAIMLSATGWVVFCIYNVFIIKQKRFPFTLLLLFNLYIILIIKPYIIFALLPGAFMWIFSNRIYKIRNVGVRIVIVPLILGICLGLGYLILSQLSSLMGKYSIDNVTKTAFVTQYDLKQSYYQGHSFDIGLEDQSYTGMIKKSPVALLAGIYRPFIWESDNVVMLLSGIENTFILFLSIIMIFRVNITTIFSRLFAEPFLFFIFSFSLFFAAVVGLTTSNFGALSRFKTAYISFFIAAVFILLKKDSRIKQKT
jgi:hypothetical protein